MKYLLTLALLINCLLCTGQTREKGNVELTPIVGYSASFAIFDSAVLSGIHLGGYASYFFSNRWSLRSGVLYQEMGINGVELFFLTSEYSERTDYFTVPLTLNFHFGTNRNWYVNYGVCLGFLTHAKADYNDGNGYVDIKDLANPLQFGLNAGIGYKFKILPKFILVIENSNMFGLTDTRKDRTGKNFYTSFNVGTVFKI